MSDSNNSMIYKICPKSAWQQAQKTGSYSGSADDKRDGFIHFSAAAQLRGTLDKHFVGQSDLLLIGVNSTELSAALKWEPSRGGQLFPHLYADLPVKAAAWARTIALDHAGRHSLPDLAARAAGEDDAACSETVGPETISPETAGLNAVTPVSANSASVHPASALKPSGQT